MIAPYARRPPHRTLAVMRADGSVVGEPDPAVIYVSPDRVRALLTSGMGEAVTWNGDPIRYRLGEREAVVVRAEVPADDAEALGGFVTWRDQVESAGARIASIGSTAYSLLRASLAEPIRTSLGPMPALGAVIGGRQAMIRAPGTYFGADHHDLQASYPAALARLRYGGAWGIARRLTWTNIENLVSAGVPVFVSAEVRYDLDPGPLPRRPRGIRRPWESVLIQADYPTHVAPMRGFWTGAEVIAAASMGARVKIREVYVHGSPDHPFARWWERVQALRSLDGFAGTLGKITGNALYGQFAISDGERARLSFAGGRRRVTPDPLKGHGRPRVLDLAEQITGAVRARLYAEALAPGAAQVICAHTDGIWSVGSFAPVGEGWRLKESALVLDVCDPQVIAYVPAMGGDTVYKVAGVLRADAPGAFVESWRATMGSREPPSILGARLGATGTDGKGASG